MTNPAIFAGATASAAARQTARQALLAELVKARAFEPSSAIAIYADGPRRHVLTELIGLAVIRPVGDGRYYFDRERQKEQATGHGWILVAILIAVASVVASAIAIAAQ